MPILPFPMADLPPKPVTSVYRDDVYDRDYTRRSSAHQQSNWSGSPSYNERDLYKNDRRSRYSRSSYHTASSSSSHNNSSNSSFRTSTSQPSPSSSSSTSTASSLRTPPDLLLNGVVSNISLPLKGVTLVNGKIKSDSQSQRSVHLSVHHLESRLQVSL